VQEEVHSEPTESVKFDRVLQNLKRT